MIFIIHLNNLFFQQTVLLKVSVKDNFIVTTLSQHYRLKTFRSFSVLLVGFLETVVFCERDFFNVSYERRKVCTKNIAQNSNQNCLC